MKKLKVFHDTRGNTLTVWFDDASKETICEEIGGDIVIMKDKKGKVIGFEKLNYVLPYLEGREFPIEVITA